MPELIYCPHCNSDGAPIPHDCELTAALHKVADFAAFIDRVEERYADVKRQGYTVGDAIADVLRGED